MASSRSPAAPSGAPPSATTQQVVSLLLVLHLSVVFLSLSTYNALGSFRRPSALQDRLMEVLRPYTRTLDIEPGLAPYQLTQYDATNNANDLDDEYFLELEIEDEEGQPIITNLNQYGGGSPDSRQRFRAYAVQAAFFLSLQTDGEVAFGEFMRSAAGFALRQMNVDSGVLRLKRHISQPRLLSDLGSEFPPDPHDERYIDTLYEANVLLADDGEPQLIKLEGAAVVAPVIPPTDK